MKKWKKVKPFKNISFYHVYSAYCHGILASFPSRDHQKTWTWKQSPSLAPQITEKSKKGAQSGSQGTPKMTLKSIKMHTWTSKWQLGDPLEPWITKMMPQVPKMEPQGLQNVSFRYKK